MILIYRARSLFNLTANSVGFATNWWIPWDYIRLRRFKIIRLEIIQHSTARKNECFSNSRKLDKPARTSLDLRVSFTNIFYNHVSPNTLQKLRSTEFRGFHLKNIKSSDATTKLFRTSSLFQRRTVRTLQNDLFLGNARFESPCSPWFFSTILERTKEAARSHRSYSDRIMYDLVTPTVLEAVATSMTY